MTSALAEAALAHFGMTGAPNFEGRWAPVRATSDPDRLGEIKARMRAAREQRTWPALDDKRLAAWNALMISALADAGAALDRPDYRDAAVACAEFVWHEMRDADGRLLRTYNRGQARLGAYLEDHAFLLEALLTLYETTFDPRWFAAARELADTILARFSDDERGGFFATADDHEELIARRKELEDAPIPAGASAAAFGLLRLAALTGEHRYEEAALGVLRLLHVVAPQHPAAFGHLLQALDFHFAAVKEVAIVGPEPSRSSASCATSSGRTSSSPADRPTAFRCSRAASPSTAARPPTCASASPASDRSPSRTSSRRCSDQLGQRVGRLAPGARHLREMIGFFGARIFHLPTRPIVPG